MGRIRVDSCWPGQPRYCVRTVGLLLRAIASCTHTAQALYLLSALARSGCRPARPLRNPAIRCVPRSLRHYLRLLYSTSMASLRSYSVHPRVVLVAPFGAESRHVRRTTLSSIIWEVQYVVISLPSLFRLPHDLPRLLSLRSLGSFQHVQLQSVDLDHSGYRRELKNADMDDHISPERGAWSFTTPEPCL